MPKIIREALTKKRRVPFQRGIGATLKFISITNIIIGTIDEVDSFSLSNSNLPIKSPLNLIFSGTKVLSLLFWLGTAYYIN
jgi:hypothetical protein